jgi:hypothetical protein
MKTAQSKQRARSERHNPPENARRLCQPISCDYLTSPACRHFAARAAAARLAFAAAARRGFTRETKVDGSRPGAAIVGKSSAPVREIMVCGFWKSPGPLRRRAPTRHPRQRPLASWLELSCCGEIRQSASTRDESGDAGDCKGISHLGRGLTAEADLLGGGQQRHRGQSRCGQNRHHRLLSYVVVGAMRSKCGELAESHPALPSRIIADGVLAHAWQGSADGKGFQKET